MNLRKSALLLFVCLLMLGCSGESSKPAALPYAAAKQNLTTLDYDAALKNLDKTIKAAPDEPDGKEAVIVRIALLTAMAQGSSEMAEAYRIGITKPGARTLTGAYTRMRSDYLGMSRVYLMDAMETVLKQRAKLGEAPLPLKIAFPDFSGSEPAAMDRIRNGMSVQDADRFRAELETSRNSMARLMAAMTGAGEDVHKGHAAFQMGAVEFDTRVYLMELTAAFYKLRAIFETKALDDSRYLRTTIEVVQGNLDVLDKLLAARPDKDLAARAKKLRADCAAALKKIQ
ncbi:MAG: hypothetical protein M1453_09310 [Acidobacteria bacterium]|nr:hypothetical protein [Acidobacteriota bacterium]MCL5288174.1 hypothetical protein [Acidobacteriota bacterium]